MKYKYFLNLILFTNYKTYINHNIVNIIANYLYKTVLTVLK